MKYFVLFIIFLASINSASAQTTSLDSIKSGKISFSELMKEQPCLISTVAERYYTGPTFPNTFPYKQLGNVMIENPAIRYIIQNLEKEKHKNEKVNAAISTLLEYAENERLKNAVDFLKEYATQNMATQEQALHTLQEYITDDSINFLENQKHTLSGMYEDYLHTDLQVINNYVRHDSNYIWIRDASRDSVQLEILNMHDKSIQFWTNNGRTKYYRFWPVNRLGDSIGTWIEVLPGGNKLKFYTDEDVYQYAAMKKNEIDISFLPAALNKDLFKLKPVNLGELDRRYWTYYTEVSFGMTQGKLANWAGGGENSLQLLTNVKYYWNYNKHNTYWQNFVHYRFGFMKSGEEDIRKNDDRFELDSKIGHKAFKHWSYTANFNMTTQLFNTYNYPKDKERELKSNFMSPGYFVLSLGMNFKPKDNFWLNIAPIAGRWTFVRDTADIDPKKFGVSEEGKRHKREAGANVEMWSKFNNIFNIMTIENRLKGFMSYERKNRYLNEGKENEERKHIPIDATWYLTISFHINYFMNATIRTETVYNENYSRKLQFKENLQLGVNFRF